MYRITARSVKYGYYTHSSFQIYIHRKGSNSLHQYLPIKILPLEYGGEAGRMSDLWGKLIK